MPDLRPPHTTSIILATWISLTSDSAPHPDHGVHHSNGAAEADFALGNPADDAVLEPGAGLIYSESSSQPLLYQTPHKRFAGSYMQDAPQTESSEISFPFSTSNGSYFFNHGQYDHYLYMDQPIGRNFDGTPFRGTCYICGRYGHRNKDCRKRGAHYARRSSTSSGAWA